MKSAANKNQETEQRKFESLATLLLLEKEMRAQTDETALFFHIVNETHRLITYRQCVLWTVEHEYSKPKIKAVSGLSSIDDQSPYLSWLERVLFKQVKHTKKELQLNNQVVILSAEDLEDDLRQDWQEWTARYAAFAMLKNPEGELLAGLWLHRDESFSEADERLLAQLVDCYGHAFDRLKKKKNTVWSKVFKRRPSAYILLAAIILVMLTPVRLSVTGPAEVVAANPYIVSTPMNGVIDEIHVKPNEMVKEGTALFSMDSTVLKNEVDITRKQLAVAQAAFDKTSREAFSDARSKAVLAQLKAEVESYGAQLSYKQDLLKKTEIKASRDGVAVFSDPNALRGLPVKTGERVMMIAEPGDTELQIRIPSKNILNVNHDVHAKAFLNVAPLDALKADIKMVSYEATPDSDGLMTYKLRASFLEQQSKPRIGLEGTARVYGDRTVLFYQIFRRPLITLRRLLGL